MLPNKAEFNKADVLSIFNDSDCINFAGYDNCSGVSIDTRDLAAGNIFVALVGENQDGHNRVAEAFDKGASACVVNRNWHEANAELVKDKPIIIVDDTLHALAKFGNYHRNRFSIPIVAIGGANGKTTTKEITAHLLAQKFNILKTHENFNNQLGAPLMLMQLTEEHQAAVLEIGTSEPGEIFILANMVEPNLGLITNIGKEHLEKLIDLDGVELEETALFAYLAKSGGICLINSEDERLIKYRPVIPKFFSYGNHDEANLKSKIELDNKLSPTILFELDGENIEVKLKTNGYTTALNSVAAASVALQFGMTLSEIKLGLESYQNTGSFAHSYGRMSVEEFGEALIINDCYNANPDSMAAALNNLALIKCSGSKFAILGDMREMGDATEEVHNDILKSAIEKADKVYLYGDSFAKAAESNPNEKVRAFASHEELCENLLDIAQSKNDVYLVKGSRSMKMEKVVDYIKNKLSTN